MHVLCTHRGHGSGRRRRAREERGGKVGCKPWLGKAEDCSSALEIAVQYLWSVSWCCESHKLTVNRSLCNLSLLLPLTDLHCNF